MRYWREAASIILAMGPRATSKSAKLQTSPLHAAEKGQQTANSRSTEGYKVLTLKRSSSSSFMPSTVVFPGGVLRDADYSSGWSELFQKVFGSTSAPDLSRRLFDNARHSIPMLTESREWPIDPSIAFRICALRETFEESGLLLATRTPEQNASTPQVYTPPASVDVLERWRRLVQKDALAFLHMCTELQVVPNLWSLQEWSNWLTPVFRRQVTPPTKKPNRFDTLFYVCCLEADTQPLPSPDDGETAQPEFLSPSELLSRDVDAAESESDAQLPPPQRYELSAMTQFKSLDSLHTAAKQRSDGGIHRLMPVIVKCADGVMTVLPGDYMYPSTPDYDGVLEVAPQRDQTLSELTDNSKPMHRIVFEGARLRQGVLHHTGATS